MSGETVPCLGHRPLPAPEAASARMMRGGRHGALPAGADALPESFGTASGGSRVSACWSMVGERRTDRAASGKRGDEGVECGGMACGWRETGLQVSGWPASLRRHPRRALTYDGPPYFSSRQEIALPEAKNHLFTQSPISAPFSAASHAPVPITMPNFLWRLGRPRPIR